MSDIYQSDALSTIMKKAGYLQPALRRIADFIIQNPEKSKTITTRGLAGECRVAESTITRFVHELGFRNFQELKISIAEYLSARQMSDVSGDNRHVYEGISLDDDAEKIAEKIFFRNVQTLEDTKKSLNLEQISLAVDLIEEADTLIFACLGSSCVAAEEAFMRFSRAGKKCIFYRDESSQLISSAISGSGDLVIGISNSGRSTAVVRSLQAARKNGAKTVAVTAFEESPVVKSADICLFTPTKNIQPGTGLDWESTASKTAQIYVLDILYACYATRNHDKALKYLDSTYEAIKNTRT